MHNEGYFGRHFGRQEDVVWRLAHAREQHELALAVHLLRLGHRNSIPDIADALELSRVPLSKKLTGRSPAAEEDPLLWPG